jgi:hypothetical protein
MRTQVMAAYPKKIEVGPIIEKVTERYMKRQTDDYRNIGAKGPVVVRHLSRQVAILAEVMVEAINDANHHNGHSATGE